MKLTEQERVKLAQELIESSEQQDECRVWVKRRHAKGYGEKTFNGVKDRVHRFAFAVFHGDFDDAWQVCHTCDNPPCINPNHLFLGTHDDNHADKVNKGRQAQGSNHGIAKLTEADIPEIFRLRKDGLLHREIADKFGVTRSRISTILARKEWDHVVI